MKKLIAIVLILCVLLSAWLIKLGLSGDEPETSDPLGYPPSQSFQNGQILQCWNWSFNSIKENMEKISKQGFSAIQTSPIQGIKESTKESHSTMTNSWWVYYQPISFNIETNSYNALGTSSEFKAMCTEADKYGIKVIVDVVLNHMANNNSDASISSLVPSDLRTNSDCWHDITKNCWFETRWDITQFCVSGKPDLNTSNATVQEYAISFLKECIDAGADGFRFDKAKNIELPVDGDYASDFWPNVLGAVTSYAQTSKGFTPYYYGEIIDGPSGFGDKSNAQKILDSYMSFMNVTQSSVSDTIRKAVMNGDALTASRSDFFFADGSKALGTKSVLWAESHETYANGESNAAGTDVINKTWALVGSRKDASALYLARPSSDSAPIGSAGITGWASDEVKAINQFKSKFSGQAENISSSGSIVINERGTAGAIIVNCGGTTTAVDMKVNMLVNGTYRDAISGNVFKVSNGHIKGSVGETGIAVITADSSAVPDESTDTSVPDDGTARIYFDNSSYKWSTVYAYVYKDSHQNAAWPGVEMELDSATGLYIMDLEGDLANGKVVFTEHKDATSNRYPPMMQEGLEVNEKNMIFSANNSWTEYKSTETPPDDPSTSVSIYFDNKTFKWASVYAYIYNDSVQNAAWPGVPMTLDSVTGYYFIEVSGQLAEGKVVFAEHADAVTNRYPPMMQEGLYIGSRNMIFSEKNSWLEYIPSTEEAYSTIYFDNTSYKWSKVYAYVYNGAAQNAKWPGVEMTFDSEKGLFKMELNEELSYGKVIFTENADATTNRYPPSMQEGMDINGKNMVFSAKNTWKEYEEKVEPDPEKPVENKITVYFDNSSYKWLSVYAYVYDGSSQIASWPGLKMTLDSKTKLYKLEIPEELANGRIIFTERKDSVVNRYPASMEEGMEIGGKNMIFTKNNTWKEYKK